MRTLVTDPPVVLVSNRGPVSFVETESGYDITRGAGGLAGALDPVARRLGERALWLAATTSDVDRKVVSSGGTGGWVSEELGYNFRMLEIEPDLYSRYYDVVSNRMLWFANHCLWDELDIKSFGRDELDAWSNAYEPVNERFATAAAEAFDGEALVLFQDYHLATAPGYLRRSGAKHTIGHFTHSSFCGPEGLERLPRPIPRTVIEGMLGAEVVGFHVPQWVDAFYECCEHAGAAVDRGDGVVTSGGRRTWVRAYPIPIDAALLRRRAAGVEAQAWATRLSAHDGLLLVRADRAEPSKNIVRGFEAFGRLLDRRPDLVSTVRFVACLYPSRQSMPEYRRYTEAIRAVVDDVNARYPGSIELFLEDDFDRTLGALLVYDALLVNPLMDGMNLVSKEGPAVNENDGVLVLSARAGSYEQLGGHAVGIEDAGDVDDIASALERALDLGKEERRSMARELRRIAEAGKPEDWIQAQLDDLISVRRREGPVTGPC